MLDMPIRTGRRMQDAVMRLREGIARNTDERQQVNHLHRQRMTCADSIRPYANTQDWTNGMGISPSGRFQVVEEVQPGRRIFTKEGIRWDVAWALLAAVAVLCAAVLVSDLAGLGAGARTIGRLGTKIEDMADRTERLKQELAVSAGDITVCTEAVKLNLVSGSGAQTVWMTVPQELNAGAVTAELRSASTGWMTSSAGD